MPVTLNGRAELLRFFNRLEQRHATDRLLLEGAHLWPVLRVLSGGAHLSREMVETSPIPLSHVGGWAGLARGLKQRINMRPSAANDTLLFFSDPANLAVVDGRAVDRYAHPLMEAAAEIGLRSVLVVRGALPDTPMRIVRHARILAIGSMLHSASIPFWRMPRLDPATIPGAAQVLEEIRPLLPGRDLRYLIEPLHHFRFHLRFNRWLLRRMRPAHVFLSCWYGMHNMAVAHACHTLGINSTDQQHGVQGPTHLAYGRWAAMPSRGYNTMPSHFWCWDKASAEHISSWAPPGRHTPFVGGSPWLSFSSVAHEPARTGDRVVLFTLQPVKDPIPSGLIDAMRTLGPGYHWVFRLHPLGPLNAEAMMTHPDLLDLHDRFSVEDPAVVPLSRSLARADVHVTRYSSVVVEATMLGVPSIILDPHAGEIFAQYTAHHDLRVLSDIAALPEAISNTLPAGNDPRSGERISVRLQRFLSLGADRE